MSEGESYGGVDDAWEPRPGCKEAKALLVHGDQCGFDRASCPAFVRTT